MRPHSYACRGRCKESNRPQRHSTASSAKRRTCVRAPPFKFGHLCQGRRLSVAQQPNKHVDPLLFTAAFSYFFVFLPRGNYFPPAKARIMPQIRMDGHYTWPTPGPPRLDVCATWEENAWYFQPNSRERKARRSCDDHRRPGCTARRP